MGVCSWQKANHSSFSMHYAQMLIQPVGETFRTSPSGKKKSQALFYKSLKLSDHAGSSSVKVLLLGGWIGAGGEQ